MAVDFSDLGGVPVQDSKGIDFSDLGGQKVSASNPPATSPGIISRLLTGVSQIMRPYKQSQVGSPQQLLGDIPDVMNRGADWLGERATEEMGRQGINPTLSAGIGTAAQMGPTMVMSSINPLEGEASAWQNLGARAVNDQLGIAPRTLLKIAGTQNPVTSGEQLGRTLAQEGVLGKSVSETFGNAQRIRDQFGQMVGTLIDKIKGSGVPTEIPADDALQPLVDEWTRYSNGALPETRRLAKPIENIYGSLAQSSKAKNGMLGLDDLRDKMDEVGDLLQKTIPTSDKYGAFRDLYGILAKARDNIVQRIASATNDPDLSNQLLTANEGYSRYSRIMPDIKMAAAREGVTAPSLNPKEIAKNMSQRFLAGQAANSSSVGPLNLFQGAGSADRMFGNYQGGTQQ